MTVQQLRPEFNLDDPSTCVLDLVNQKPKDVLALSEAITAKTRTGLDLGPVPVTTGWNEITPAIALNLLLRNEQNRKIDPATVFFYGRQMADGQWKKTGQPMLIDSNGHLADAQHRNLAVLISGATISSYVVTGIDPIPGLFAYIDSARSRTAATALQTAGKNGVSPVIVKVIKIAEEVRLGVYNSTGAAKLQRMSPAEVLQISDRYSGAQKAARSAASDWEAAVEYLSGRKDIIAYLGMKITELHGEDKADDFFEDLIDNVERQPDDPIAALRKEIDRDARADKPMKKHYMLGNLIKAFNAWHRGEPLGRRWAMQVNEDFPALDGSDDQPQADAAEETEKLGRVARPAPSPVETKKCQRIATSSGCTHC
jgi:hypothetical protein